MINQRTEPAELGFEAEAEAVKLPFEADVV